MYDMFWKASAFKQTIPEEWKNKGDIWGLTPEKQRTADNCGCFVFCFFSCVGQSTRPNLIGPTKGVTGRFLLKRAI